VLLRSDRERVTRKRADGRRALLTAGLGLVAMWLLSACDPDATTFVVNSEADLVDADPGDGVCQTSTPGECTLRAAVMEANVDVGADTVVLEQGHRYELTRAGTGEDGAATGDLDVTEKITVVGDATIDANGLDRVLDVHAGIFTLDEATVTGGRASSGSGVNGRPGTELHIRRATVRGNVSTDLIGCWYPVTSPGTPAFCDLTRPAGAGIAAHSTLHLAESTVTGNHAEGGGPGPGGGYCQFAPPYAVCGWSHGAGIFIGETGSITNSTVSRNSAEAGYGVGISSLSGSVTILSSTIVDNGASQLPPYLPERYQQVGSCCVHLPGGGAGTFNISGTIVGGMGPLCAGVTSGGHNIATDTSCGLDQPSDRSDLDPLLGALTDNGGPTLTHLPGVGSPARDAVPAGTAVLCDDVLSADQRGLPRPSGAACDVGAVERQPTDP
jgi:CSLREA domain-containing protein